MSVLQGVSRRSVYHQYGIITSRTDVIFRSIGKHLLPQVIPQPMHALMCIRSAIAPRKVCSSIYVACMPGMECLTLLSRNSGWCHEVYNKQRIPSEHHTSAATVCSHCSSVRCRGQQEWPMNSRNGLRWCASDRTTDSNTSTVVLLSVQGIQ